MAQATTWWPERDILLERAQDSAQQIDVTPTGAGVIGLFVDEALQLLAFVPIVTGLVTLYFAVTTPKEKS